MIGPIRRLLIEAGRAKQARAFWQASAEVLSDWAGGAHVRLVYKGLSESGTAEAGSAAQAGESCIADYHDAEGHHVQATFRGLPEGVPTEPLRSGVEIATHLAVMVARRATLERERRLGTRSEEHTSELQSQSNIVCRLLLEKKKKKENAGQRQEIEKRKHQDARCTRKGHRT